MTKSPVRHIPDGKQKEKGTKQKILDSALEEFSKHGLAGSRVEQIAERAGVNKAMLYYHYSSKENLYQEVIESIFRVATERLSEILITPQSLEEIFKEMIEFYTDLFNSQPAFTPILIRELANSESSMIENIAEIISVSGAPVQIKRLIAAGEKKGHLRPINIRHAIVLFLSLNIGYFVCAPIMDRVWNIKNRDKFIRERKKEVLDIFLNGIKSR